MPADQIKVRGISGVMGKESLIVPPLKEPSLCTGKL